MFRNYFVTALRNIRKNTLTSLITVIGLSIGIACASFIFLYVQNELSFDKFLPGYDRVYRLMIKATTFEGSELLTPLMNMDIRNPLLSQEFGIENLTQIIVSDAELGIGNRNYFEPNSFYFTDSSFLKVFDYPLLMGDKATALEKPNTVILTTAMARKYFGDANPLGKIITLKNSRVGGAVNSLTVTGVFAEIPANTSFQFGFVMNCPFAQYVAAALDYYRQTYHLDIPEGMVKAEGQTFVMLRPGVSQRLLQRTLNQAIDRLPTNDAKYVYKDYQLLSERLDRIYLSSKISLPTEKKGNILFIFLLAGLGIIVIFIACINVINLTTARALTREKEIGIRKTLGASRGELIAQHLVESVLLSIISLLFALVIVEVCLPLFNNLVQRDLAIHYLGNPLYLLSALAVAVIIGILSGLYPAFGLSSLNTIKALKGQKTPGSRRFREVMVVVQFVFSIGLFIVSAVILREFQTLKATSAGLDTKNLYMVRLNAPDIENELPTLKKSIRGVPGVKEVSATSFAAWQYGNYVRDLPIQSARTQYVDLMVVDANYLHIQGVDIVKGRDFEENADTEDMVQLVVNEAAQRELGCGIGTRFQQEQIKGRVVGIARDFDYLLPSGRVRPLVLTIHSPFLINTSYAPGPIHPTYLLVKIAPEGRQQTLEKIGGIWKDLNPGTSFECASVEQEMQRQLDDLNRSVQSVLYISTFLAFLLSGLGLFGLASFEIERRTKEVGIRKSLGATSVQIALQFIGGFLKLVALANIVAWPLAFALIRLVFTLIQYPHPLVIGPAIFLEVGLISVVLMVVTVGSQTLRAASVNPVNTLRYE